MLRDRRAPCGRRAAQSLARRQAAAGALRSRRGAQGAEQGGAGAPAADLWRYRELLPVRRAQDIVSLGEAVTPLVAMPKLAGGAGRGGDSGQGRRPAADRLVQGARPGHGGVDGEGARRRPHGDADQRQCRRGARRLCQPRRHQDHGLLPAGYAGGECQRDRAAGRERLPRQRPDRRLRQDRRRGQGEARLVRYLDARRSRTGSRARRRWGSSSPSSSAGRCPT